MARRLYFGVIEAGSEGFGIYFPDFPGCVSAGDDLEGLARMGAEALQFHIDGMVEDGEFLPQPSMPDMAHERSELPDADLRGLLGIEVTIPAFPQTVEVPIETALVQEVDRLSQNRRQFIVDATRRELDRLKKSA